MIREIPQNIMNLAKIAVLAAQKGGKKILKSKETISYRYINNTNPSSSLDLIIENTIISVIKKMRADDGIIGEEGGVINSKNGVRWIIDPIDGTMNYLHNIPHWCISIACEKLINEQWTTIVGVVYDVLKNEFFSAIQGYGAKINNNKLFVPQTRSLQKALIATEFSYNIATRLEQINMISNLVNVVKDIRSTGSSALDICWIALGRFDGFFESDLSYWDWAAAALILREAGGTVSPFQEGIIASNRLIHKQLIQRISLK